MKEKADIKRQASFPQRPWLGWGISLFLLLVFAVVMFSPVIGADEILLTTDDSIGILRVVKESLPNAFSGAWMDMYLVGYPRQVLFNWTNFLLMVFSLPLFVDIVHGLDLYLASVFLMLFLRGKGLGWPPCLLGSLTAFWLGSNFTLTYAGHIGKYGVLVFAPMCLWLGDLAVRRVSIRYALVAGGAMGMMFLEQVDVALFFSLPLGGYVLFALFRNHGWKLSVWAKVVVPMLGLAFFMALHPLFQGYQLFVSDSQPQQEDIDRQVAWEFATQWSWPPQESMSLIAPGHKGWRSGEPEGPYWGVMGRSAGWQKPGDPGFQNFKLESVYVGAIPILLAVWICLISWWAKERDSDRYWEVLFWGVTCLFVFLLSCGKFLPFYRVLYTFPVISSVRNPNKFLQVFQVALGILAAYGLGGLLGTLRVSVREGVSLAVRRNLVVGAVVVLALVFFWWLESVFSADELVANLSRGGYSGVAERIVALKTHALAHAVLLLGAGVVLVAWFSLARGEGPRWLGPAMAWSVVAVVAVDATLLSQHYVTTMQIAPIQNNLVIQQINKRRNHHRVAIVNQGQIPFYNRWLTYDFAYHQVPTFNFLAMPRMQRDYKVFLEAMRRYPERLWALSGVNQIMAPGEVWRQFSANPETKDRYELVYSYNVKAGPRQTVDVMSNQPGRHCLIWRKGPPTRFALIDSWDTRSSEETLEILSAPGYVPFRTVHLSESPDPLPPALDQGQGMVGEVRVQRYKAGSVQLRVSTEKDAILRIADRYDSHWEATVGGMAVPVLAADFLYQAVPVRAGISVVKLTYRRASPTLTVLYGALGVWLGAAILLVVQRVRECRKSVT